MGGVVESVGLWLEILVSCSSCLQQWDGLEGFVQWLRRWVRRGNWSLDLVRDLDVLLVMLQKNIYIFNRQRYFLKQIIHTTSTPSQKR